MGKVIQVLDTQTGKISYIDFLDNTKKLTDHSNLCLENKIKQIIASIIGGGGGGIDQNPIAIFNINSQETVRRIATLTLFGSLTNVSTDDVSLINSSQLVFKQGTYLLDGNIRVEAGMSLVQITKFITTYSNGLIIDFISVEPELPQIIPSSGIVLRVRMRVTSPNDGGSLTLSESFVLPDNTTVTFIRITGSINITK